MLNLLRRFKHYIIVFGLTILGHFLGFGREIATAFYFGTSDIADGILVGIIPLTLYASVFGSAYANAAIVHIKSTENSSVIKDAIFTLVVISVCSALFFLLGAEHIVSLMAPGLKNEGALLAQAFIKLSSVGVLFVTLSSLGRGLLHLDKRFARASISDLMPNVGMILGIVILYQFYGIYGLALGGIAGYFLQFIFVSQWRFYCFSFKQFSTIFSKHQRTILKSTALAAISYSVVYVDVLVDRYFASQLFEGAIATMNYGQKIMLLPLYTFIFAITTVIFPKLIQSQNNVIEFNRIKKQLYLVTFIASLFITLFVVIFGKFIVSLFFNYGAFTSGDVINTYQVLVVYIIGLTGHAFVLVASKVRYAKQDFKTPLVAGITGAAVNVVLDIVLVDDFGMLGLAWATTVSALVNAFLLIFMNKNKTTNA